MSAEEVRDFLAEKMVMQCATVGPRGVPHMVPLWFVGDAGELRGWTYAKSQKARNLERDPRASLQVEAGEQYDQLRGILLRCDVTIHRGAEDVAQLGLEIFARYTGADLPEETRAMVQAQAPKRVAFEFVERSRATWDHRKLAGVY